MKKKAILLLILITVSLFIYYYLSQKNSKSELAQPETVKNIQVNEDNEDFEEQINELGSAKSDDFHIEEIMRNYQHLIVEAINSDDFSLVENLLVKGSNLYNSQKQLVRRLAEKQIKEKLIDFTIEEINYVDDLTVKVYVYEKIGIKYPHNQDYRIKEYYWIYTVNIFDGAYRLSEIEKWNKQ
ncbi:MAG TPA: hypothetical protein PL158_13865 [Bacillota bacterium]|jgi:uncharacterized Zn ribbon protein|nr:hypothetical protein [Bacillota bacterium]HOL11071.1 hypothetical protein [Bacillota bacterium]